MAGNDPQHLGNGRTLDDADQLSSVVLLGMAIAGGLVAVLVSTFLV
jgi:hypothetical protein